MDPDGLNDEEWAATYAVLQDIRKKEAGEK
jgi:hypothetical protein